MREEKENQSKRLRYRWVLLSLLLVPGTDGHREVYRLSSGKFTLIVLHLTASFPWFWHCGAASNLSGGIRCAFDTVPGFTPGGPLGDGGGLSDEQDNIATEATRARGYAPGCTTHLARIGTVAL